MAQPVKKPVTISKKSNQESADIDFAFGKENYRIMLLGIVVILIGFALMAGGSPDDPTKFSNEIFNARRITIAPIVVLAGFIIEVWAIVKKAKD